MVHDGFGGNSTIADWTPSKAVFFQYFDDTAASINDKVMLSSSKQFVLDVADAVSKVTFDDWC